MDSIASTRPAEALASFDRGPSATEFAYRSLRAAILSLSLPPRTVISRGTLAAELGVSQTPVREALIRLQEETLIEVVPHSATRVARIDLDNARQAHFLRLSVELEAVRVVAARQDDTAAALEDEIGRQRALLAQGDAAGFAAADTAFHGLLYNAGGVAGLWELIRSRSGHLDRLRRLHLPSPGKGEMILREHGAIAAAIRQHAPEAAAQALRRHLSHTFGELDSVRAVHPDYF
ncbi:GntR family transcriptional regulator [Roseomonas sp. NAR14]|uniref:GntR family transcriptional regulator n=1 Tax=Roseomonas acroporae TaxID=2937791 RepID=A0A9X1Y8C4_9PROT|nr:GntR family transcriptional regulator [Roseomonas acroporae]MCK8783962.1 GntR family transcriptional regulator [Roseomonas acroporae]